MGSGNLLTTLSIIVPYREAEGRKRLLPCVMRYLRRDYRAAEIILVEESEEQTIFAMPEVDRVIHVRSGERFSKGRALNAGVRATDTTYLLLHDADIIAEPGYVPKVMEYLRQGYEFVRLGADVILLNDAATGRVARGITPPFDTTKDDWLGQWETFPGGSWGITRGCYNNLGGIDEKMYRQQDKAFIRVAKDMAKCLFRPEFRFVHMYHTGAKPWPEVVECMKGVRERKAENIAAENRKANKP